MTSRTGALSGVLVGACSGLFAMAAHAVAGGQVPTGPTLVLIALVCAAVGALAGANGQARVVGLIAAVGAGQLLTHVVLAVSAGHHGGHEILPSVPMVFAHTLAAVALGLLIGLVAHLYQVCASVLCWLILTLVHRGSPSAPRRRHHTTSVVIQQLLLRSGLGMRAPPRTVSLGG